MAKWIRNVGPKYIFFVLTILIISGCYSPAHPEWRVSLAPGGKLYLVHRGFWKNEEYLIKKIDNEWYWDSLEGYKKIIVPHENQCDEAGDNLVLDKGGDVFILNKDQTERKALKVINGEWNEYGDEGWYEIDFGPV